MKTDPRRFAPLGLALSGIGFLTALGVLVVRAFAAFGLYTPPDGELLNRVLIIAVAVFVVGFAVYALLDPERVRKFLTGRQVQYGSNSFILFIAFTGILVVLNILAQQYPQRWDVTEDKSHTLAPETIQALQSLPEPVYATAFYSVRLNTETVGQLLEDFKAKSNGNFDYQFMDLDTNPVLVNQLGITGDGKILLQMGENQELVTFASERELTGGLIRLLNPDKPVLYFLTGEGEHDTENSGEASYTRVRQVLESKNYVVNILNLQAQNAIPEDARALVVAGPLVPLTESSLTLIKDFVNNGGDLLVLSNPVPLTQFGDQPDPLAEYLAADWGITLDNNIVVDTNSPSSPFFAVGAQYALHPITEKMQGIAAIFPYSRSITVSTENTDVSPTVLVLTIDQSWGETDFSAMEEQQALAYDEGADTIGPMTLAAAAENSTTESRVVVFGSSSFAQDGNFDFSGNGDMFVNAIDWLAEQESLIGLTESETITRTFTPPGSLQFILTIVSAICIIPLVIIGAGVYAWVMRRRRG
ncbi:MAG: GldG family protein [Anaerolineales bacterium]|nr:GldG family protein [Anaerolineales bacterium]